MNAHVHVPCDSQLAFLVLGYSSKICLFLGILQILIRFISYMWIALYLRQIKNRK